MFCVVVLNVTILFFFSLICGAFDVCQSCQACRGVYLDLFDCVYMNDLSCSLACADSAAPMSAVSGATPAPSLSRSPIAAPTSSSSPVVAAPPASVAPGPGLSV